DARIDHCANDIDHETDYDDDSGVEHDNPLDHRHVLRGHSVQKKDADSFDGERLFSEHGTGKENGELKTENGHYRHQSVLERVLVHDGSSWHAAGAVHGTSAPLQRPFAGSHRSQTPKISWSTSPSQKIGMTQIIVPNIRTARSTGLSRCAPANTPSGIPTRDATSMPPIAISTVAGKRPEIKLQTDWPV